MLHLQCRVTHGVRFIRYPPQQLVLLSSRGFVNKKHSKVKPIRNAMHPNSKLRKASDYLEYDIHTLAAGIDIHLSHQGTEIGNAALDSLLLRARLLIDFFMSDNAQSDDVIAIDFFHDYDPKPYKPHLTVAIRREREKINKRIMHMTTKPMPRLRSHQHYDLNKIVLPLIAAFRKWLSVVPDQRLQQPATDSRKTYEKHLLRIERIFQQSAAKNKTDGS